MPLILTPPVRPWRGFRGMDSWGSGNFGASRDGGSRRHDGLDCITVPGDAIVSPVRGTVVHIGIAYPGSTLGSVHIEGDVEWTGWRLEILYLLPDPGLGGRYVMAADRLGDAQDVTGYWRAKDPTHPGEMRNHIHMRIRVTEPRLIDPAHHMPDNLVVSGGLRT